MCRPCVRTGQVEVNGGEAEDALVVAELSLCLEVDLGLVSRVSIVGM